MNTNVDKIFSYLQGIAEIILKWLVDLGIIKLQNLDDGTINQFIFAGWFYSLLIIMIFLSIVLFLISKIRFTKRFFKGFGNVLFIFLGVFAIQTIFFAMLIQKLDEQTLVKKEIIPVSRKEFIKNDSNSVESIRLSFANSDKEFYPSLFKEGDQLKLKVKLKSGDELEKTFTASNNNLEIEKSTENKVESVDKQSLKIIKKWLDFEEESEDYQFIVKLKTVDPFFDN
ncbi:MAG: hypothetical protein HXM94_01030 [Parvimonas micra]|uniref:Uncharacterized protein n=1 Tax=Parvimonas micra TaxID=33033 RepID=A0A930DY34_9FIRM|nr:hypothetical protein [Parvimonas micra]MBF1306359.1 hypothetical protein [Parvimonas micra]